MRTLLTILFFLFHSDSCYSQNSYKGRLISALTNKPIRSGFIEKDGKMIAGTDTLGYFTIELDNPDNINLVIYSAEVGWVFAENLYFKKDDILLINLEPECIYSSQKDISTDSIKLLTSFGAFSPLLTKKDYRFEKKYNLFYFNDGGCIGNTAEDCIIIYNKEIGLYLDKKYGKKWRKKVNKGVSGLD